MLHFGLGLVPRPSTRSPSPVGLFKRALTQIREPRGYLKPSAISGKIEIIREAGKEMATRISFTSKLLRRRFASNPSPLYSFSSNFSSAANEFTSENDVVPTSGISRPLSEILKELNKKVPDSLVKHRTERDGFSIKYIPWHIVNRIMNVHAPEWSGECRSITYSPDGKSVSVVYRVTIHGTDAKIYRESTGTAPMTEPGYGDPLQKAEGMAFRRACARFGLGLHLYHEDME